MTTFSRSMIPSVLEKQGKTSHVIPMVCVFQGLLCIQSYKGSCLLFIFSILRY